MPADCDEAVADLLPTASAAGPARRDDRAALQPAPGPAPGVTQAPCPATSGGTSEMDTPCWDAAVAANSAWDSCLDDHVKANLWIAPDSLLAKCYPETVAYYFGSCLRVNNNLPSECRAWVDNAIVNIIRNFREEAGLPNPPPPPAQGERDKLEKLGPGPWRDYVACATAQAYAGHEDDAYNNPRASCRPEWEIWALDEIAHGRADRISQDDPFVVVGLDRVAECRNALAQGGQYGADPPADVVQRLCDPPPR